MPDSTVIPTIDDMMEDPGPAKTAVPKIGELIASLGGAMSPDVRTIIPALEELGETISGYDPTPPVEIDALEVTANGTYEAEEGHAYSPVTVSVSGGSGDGGDPIRFFDYDGTLVASYAEVPESLPDVPTHDRLTNGTWNYTLDGIERQFDAVGACDVGANYDTVSGGTEIDIELVDDARLSPTLRLAVKGTAVVDWGDGSGTTTCRGSSLTSTSAAKHTYPSVGAYTITITPNVGSRYAMYGGNENVPLLSDSSTSIYNNGAYANCVKSVRVGRSCEVGNNAFYYCNALDSITLSSGAASIGNNAFRECYSLKSVTIPNSATGIFANVFFNCHMLKSVIIPSSVTGIGTSAFSGCYSLGSITIPDSVTAIISETFKTCCSLKSVTIPNSVGTIGDSAFIGCYSLGSITIPDSVTSIGRSAFSSCSALNAVTIPGSVTKIGDSAFYNCQSLKSAVIPNSVTSIGVSAFSNCHAIDGVIVPDGVTFIGNSMFNNCYSLKSAVIPSSVTGIGISAFNYCYSLTSITIPSSVTNIGAGAFSRCGSAAEFHLERNEPPTLSASDAFNSISSDCKFYVPYSEDHSILDAYKTATNWSTYADRMVEEEA